MTPRHTLIEKENEKMNKGKRKTTAPFIPEVIGYNNATNSVICLESERSIAVTDFWTKERLTDEFANHLLGVKADGESLVVPTGHGSRIQGILVVVNASLQFERRNPVPCRKYLIRTEKLVVSYSNLRSPVFVINLSDLTNRLKAELIDLQRYKVTLSDVLHSVVERIFAAAGSSWFYQSAASEIQVRIDP